MRLRRGPRIGRLAIQFGLAFALAVASAGALVFSLAEARLAHEIDQSLARDRTRLMAPSAPLVAQNIRAWEASRSIAEKGHVLIGRDGTLDRSFADILQDLDTALRRIETRR